MNRLVERSWAAGAVVAFTVFALGMACGVIGGMGQRSGVVRPSAEQLSIGGILVHNGAVLAWLSLGLLSGGLVSLATMMLNGVMLGLVVGAQLAAGDPGPLISGILPHLLPEVAAYGLSAGASLVVGVQVVRDVVRGRWEPKPWLRWSLWQLAAFGMLAVAAVVEGAVSHA